MADAKQFSLSLDAFANNTKARIRLAVRSIALEILKRLVMKSPVLSGRFRGNWYVSFDSFVTTVSDDIDTGGTQTIDRGLQVLTAIVLGQSIWIVNNLPYSRRLEYGWSQRQAPGGMVRPTLLEVAGSVIAGEAIAYALQKIGAVRT